MGDKNPEQADIDLLRERLEKADLPDEIRKEVQRELSRLERLSAQSPDFHVLRTYIELALELPWRVSTQDTIEIANARRVLDEDHYDLKEVKQRILEFLGVMKMNPKAKAPILCFAGPPGVGKTSLGQSIARALGRKFERMSLGGLHDEAELRGHRRTYIGAMPGRLIQAMRRAGSNNPVIMLDEIDKLSHDYRGDPASALLEVLDPEQNKAFRDNYLDLPFDLSKVFFITTANTLDSVPRPLLDRMETLRLSGYTEEEKIQIARRYLIPRQFREAGLDDGKLALTDLALRRIVSGYTREAGLRQLERAIGRVSRKTALRFAEGDAGAVSVDAEKPGGFARPRDVHAGAGAPATAARGRDGPSLDRDGRRCALHRIDSAAPTARDSRSPDSWARSCRNPPKPRRVTSGRTRASSASIPRCSARTASTCMYLPARLPRTGRRPAVTAVVALVSMYTRHSVRHDTAMTGEVTLSGLVLPIGGLKEKVLAARRAGIRRIVLPKSQPERLARRARRGAPPRWSSSSPSMLRTCSPRRFQRWRRDSWGLPRNRTHPSCLASVVTKLE